MPPPRARRTERIIRRSVLLVLLLWLTFGAVYVSVAFQPAGYAPSVLDSDRDVQVEQTAEALVFRPTTAASNATGFILYPGCPVPVAAYAPLARALAAHGHPTHVMRVAYRCATREEQQQELFARTVSLIQSDRRGWVLGGHSRGGALASRFAFDHPGQLSGLMLIGSAHPRDVDLSGLSLPVTVVFGTRDGVAAPSAVLANAPRLPRSTRWISIEGGNHVQFAFYRFQLWDHRATITREAQQQQTLDAILSALAR
jgi:Alpha/beta hydrolase family